VRRVSVVGNSGAGKSTLARELAARLGVPYVELDAIFHQPGWTPLPPGSFVRQVAAAAAADGWVIDGNYRAVRPLVWARADTVVWLDLPKRTVMRQIIWRTLRRAALGAELWNGNRERWRNLFSLNPEESVIAWSWRKHQEYKQRYAAAARDPAFAGLSFVRIASRRQARCFPSLSAGGAGVAPARPARQTRSMATHYRAPGWFTRNVANRLVAFLTHRGVSLLGSRVLAVKGRTSGEWRTTPVNLLDHQGKRYLVSARGEGQWVRNLRAAGTGELRLGKHTEAFRGRELSDEEKVPVLRAYLKRWKAEVGVFFDGVGPDSGDEQIQAIAHRHPAFEVLPPP
jgi:deazaflavin-dependent oxidoreductase (nitroreductase family)